jgi:hypothetical protein
MMQLSSDEAAMQALIIECLTNPKKRVSMPMRIAISKYMRLCHEAKARLEALR